MMIRYIYLSSANCLELKIKPIFFKKPCFLFFVIVFSYIAHCLNLVATQLLNIFLIAEAELHS